MSILRKIFGVSLLIFSFLLILATISSALNTFNNTPKESGAERIGYIFGSVLFLLFMGWLIYFIIKKALMLLKNKPQNSIEEIGKS